MTNRLNHGEHGGHGDRKEVALVSKELTGKIIAAAIDVHNELGPGLLETSYEICLAHLLREQGLTVEQQKPVPVKFRGVTIQSGYKLDLLVDQFAPVHEAQLLSYLRLTGKKVGLLINFHVPRLHDGIKRMVL